MSTRLLLRFALAFTLCLSASGCMKPAYLLPGLTLPSGSTVVNKTTGNSKSGSAPALPIPMSVPGMPNAANSEYVMVSFSNSGGWPAVSSHFDSLLGGMGYNDSFKALLGTNNVPGMPNFSGMRMYQKSGSKYSVMLMDTAGMMSAAGGAGGTPPGVPGMGDFSLYVTRMK